MSLMYINYQWRSICKVQIPRDILFSTNAPKMENARSLSLCFLEDYAKG